jgi:MYXO-CTERM domain-containing protein
VNGSEVCDDGIQNGAYDHCDATCTGPGPYCGDGVVNGSETCDDGGLNGTASHCNATCTGHVPAAAKADGGGGCGGCSSGGTGGAGWLALGTLAALLAPRRRL